MSADNEYKKLFKTGPGNRGRIRKPVKSVVAQRSKKLCSEVGSPRTRFSSNYESENSDIEEKYEPNEVVYVTPMNQRKSAILLDEELGVEIINSIKSLTRQVQQLDKKVSVMTREVSVIKERLQNFNHFAQSEDILGNLLPDFPLYASEEFLALEENVKRSEDMAQQLTNFFLRTGGKDFGSFLRGNLKAVLMDVAASAFSWTGQAGNIKVKSFYTMKLLKEVCHATFASTENDMDTTIKVYFNRAKDRLKKAEKKGNIAKCDDDATSL